MIGDGGATSEDVVVSYGDRAADDDTPGKETVLTDSNVVAQMAMVVDFRALSDYRILEAAAVDVHARADMHVVFDD